MSTTLHNLKARGAAFSTDGQRQLHEGTSGIGVAVCSCGWTSEIQPSGNARKKAHAAHKEEQAIDDLDSPGLEKDISDQLLDEGHVDLLDGEIQPKTDELPEGVVTLTDTHKVWTHRNGSTFEIDRHLLKPDEEGYLPPETESEEGQLPNGDPDWELLGHTASEGEETQYTGTYTWRGNYSIVFAPSAVDLAAVFSDKLLVETRVNSAVNRESLVSGPKEQVKGFLELLAVVETLSMEHLHEWQREHRAERKGFTDMQKFLQHREIIAEYLRGRATELAEIKSV